MLGALDAAGMYDANPDDLKPVEAAYLAYRKDGLPGTGITARRGALYTGGSTYDVDDAAQRDVRGGSALCLCTSSAPRPAVARRR